VSLTDDEQREALEAEYLRRLAEQDMARWRQHIAHGESAAPVVPLDDDQRNMLRKLRRVFHARKDEKASS
jgi:hypothetical protein